MKGLHLVREFEGLQLKESKTIKEYSTKFVAPPYPTLLEGRT